jgi:multidrug resistance efflux pump
MQLATRNLARLRELYKNLAISQRELDQAASDQQTAGVFVPHTAALTLLAG